MNVDPAKTVEAVEAHFRQNFEERGDLGASVSIWQHGQEVLSLGAGFCDRERAHPWTVKTPVLVWSATKGPASACVLHVMERHGERLDTPVAAYWPEFARQGKEKVTVAQLLSHQAGVAALDEPADVLDHAAVIAAIEKQTPNWPLGEAHGYHPRTFGFLLDELIRRIEGIPLGDYWQRWFATPLDLDFWIGLPPERLSEPAIVYPARQPETQSQDADFFKALGQSESLTARAFASPKGLHGVTLMNQPHARMAQLPGFGGIGTASSLAKFYAMLANGGTLDGIRFFANTDAMSTPQVQGNDATLQRITRFSAGFMQDPTNARDITNSSGTKLRNLFGPSQLAFGQPGAGGSHAFADPENGIAFAYTMNQMEAGVMPGEKALGMVRALYS